MGLGAARDLARRGVPVTLVHCGAGRPPASRSRFARFRNAPDVAHPAAVVEWLCEFARGAPVKPVLVPAQDHAVLLIQRARAKLAQHYHFYLWDSELLTQLGSKTDLGRIAERYGLPAPRTVSPRSRAEAEELCSRMRLPYIVKPEFTNSWWTETACSLGLGEKAIEVANTEELLSVYDRSQQVGAKIVVQEKIVGPDSNHLSYLTFVAPNGEFSGEMIARKMRIYPVRFGVASYAESATTDDAMRMGKDILHRLGYRGFASVQMKRDERDGRLYLIEINLRLPLVLGLALSAGLSFPYYYYRTSLGLDYAVGQLKVGRRWMAVGRDVRSMRVFVRDGTCTWVQWIGDLLKSRSFPLLSLGDPAPAIASAFEWLRMALRSRLAGPKRVVAERFITHGKMPV